MTGGYDAEISFNPASTTLSIPIRIRERHMTPETGEVWVQPIGTHLLVTIPSERDAIRIHIPLTEWLAERAFSRKLCGANGGLINVGRWADVIDHDDGDVAVRIEVVNHARGILP